MLPSAHYLYLHPLPLPLPLQRSTQANFGADYPVGFLEGRKKLLQVYLSTPSLRRKMSSAELCGARVECGLEDRIDETVSKHLLAADTIMRI